VSSSNCLELRDRHALEIAGQRKVRGNGDLACPPAPAALFREETRRVEGVAMSHKPCPCPAVTSPGYGFSFSRRLAVAVTESD
jgi:hypothetical protein